MTKFFIPLVALALTSPLAQAQTFNVKKIKGKQAIIQMTSGTFTEGQSVTVGGGEAMTSTLDSGGSSGSRDNYLGLDFGFTSAKVGTVTQTALALEIKYGWNKGTMEYGVLGGFASTSGGVSTSTFSVGGNFDYNFSENRPGVDGVMFVGIEASYGSTSPGSVTNITLYPSVGYKWFALGNATAIRFDAGMRMVQSSVSGKSTTDTQPAVGGGLAVYF
jgi:hypothetical protein